MPWYAVHYKDGHPQAGELYSIGSVVADDATLDAKGLVKTLLGDTQPDMHTQRWDKATRQFVLRVVKDRLDDILTDAQFDELKTIWQSLTLQQKTAIRNALITLLGPLRYRQEDEPIALG